MCQVSDFHRELIDPVVFCIEVLQQNDINEKVVGKLGDIFVRLYLQGREPRQAVDAVRKPWQLVVRQVELCEICAHTHGLVQLRNEIMREQEYFELQVGADVLGHAPDTVFREIYFPTTVRALRPVFCRRTIHEQFDVNRVRPNVLVIINELLLCARCKHMLCEFDRRNGTLRPDVTRWCHNGIVIDGQLLEILAQFAYLDGDSLNLVVVERKGVEASGSPD